MNNLLNTIAGLLASVASLPADKMPVATLCLIALGLVGVVSYIALQK